jgi:hypothetical protein
MTQTPGPGYHIEPSPYPSRFDTPVPDPFDSLPSSTAPLALKTRRRPSEGTSMKSGLGREGGRGESPVVGDYSRPAPPPRSARRVESGRSERFSDDDLR